jgi:hypothetical protein
MTMFSSYRPFIVIAGAVIVGAYLVPMMAPQPAMPATAKQVPDFSGSWQRAGQFPSTFEVPADKQPGPLVNTITGENAGLIWVADHTNPMLKPWNAEYLKKRGEQEIIEVNNVAHNLCKMSGVPQVINLREPVQFLQEPHMITIIYQRDHTVRWVYLNEEHPKDLKPSWYGHSVGHYEGDTLVIDTIGMNDLTGIDRFNTQHTTQLHVVERYRMVQDGQALRVDITVEDPGAFNSTWYAQATYRRQPHELINEIVCAENNYDILTRTEFPIPKDETPDF